MWDSLCAEYLGLKQSAKDDLLEAEAVVASAGRPAKSATAGTKKSAGKKPKAVKIEV